MNGMIGLVKETLVRRYGDRIWDGGARDRAREGDGASDALICWLGREAIPALSRSYPSLFERYGSLESFVRGLADDLPALRAGSGGMPGTASLDPRSAPDGSLLVRIEGDAPLCALVQGVIAGAAVRYDEPATIQELKCRKRGDNVCVLRVRVHGEDLGRDHGPDLEAARAAGSR